MNSSRPSQAAIGSRPKLDAAQRRYFLALANLILVMAVTSLMVFGAAPDAGAGPDQANDNLILGPIRLLCVLGGLLAAGALLYSWFHMVGTNDPADRSAPSDRNS